MITVISGTNRLNNTTIKIAEQVQQQLRQKKADAKLLNLEDLPNDFLLASRFTDPNQPLEFLKLQEEYVFPAEKFVFVVPEYNGSIPGILKLFLDSCDIKRAFYFKKATLIGISSGRAGNLRGLDHLTNILHYLRMTVHPNKLPLSKIDDELDENQKFKHPATIKALDMQMQQLLEF